MKHFFRFALLLLLSTAIIFSCKNDDFEDALEGLDNQEVSKALNSYGDKLAKTLAYSFGDKDSHDLLNGIIAHCNRLKYHDTEVLLSEVAYEKVNENQTMLDKIVQSHSKVFGSSLEESTRYFEQMISQFPSMVIAYRSVFQEGYSLKEYLERGNASLKVVHVNGLQREGDKLYGFNAEGKRVGVNNEVFFAVHLSEIHKIDGTLIAAHSPASSTNNNGQSLGEVTTRTSWIYLDEGECALPSEPEPQTCEDPVISNFAAEVKDGYVELTWESDDMPLSQWRRFIIERRDMNGQTADYSYFKYSCGGPNFTTIPEGPYLPNTTYQYRIRAVIWSHDPDGFCGDGYSDWVTITTDDSFAVSPPESFTVDNDESGKLQFRWSPPSPNGQSAAYKIEYLPTTGSQWQEVVEIDPSIAQFADDNGNPVTSYLWSHPSNLLGEKVLFRIKNKWQGTWSTLAFNNFHYPAYRDTEESSFVHRIKIGDLGQYETPEMGLPEIQTTYGTSEAPFGVGVPAGTNASSGAPVRYVPCKREAILGSEEELIMWGEIENGWYYPNGNYGLCGEERDWLIGFEQIPIIPFPFGVPCYFDPFGCITVTVVEATVLDYQPVTAIFEWPDENYNRYLGLLFNEIDNNEERKEAVDITEEKKFSTSGKVGVEIGPVDIGGDIGYEKSETQEFTILYPGDRFFMGSLELKYWDEPEKTYFLVGSGDIADIKRLNSASGVEIVRCENACNGKLEDKDLSARQ